MARLHCPGRNAALGKAGPRSFRYVKDGGAMRPFDKLKGCSGGRKGEAMHSSESRKGPKNSSKAPSAGNRPISGQKSRPQAAAFTATDETKARTDKRREQPERWDGME